MSDVYFGYGSNLNLDDWKEWCKKEDCDPDSIKALPGIFVLPDYELSFHYYSVTREGGALDVIPKTGHAVAGKMFKVSEEGWRLLDRKEGAPNVYERKLVYTLAEDGEKVRAITYVVTHEKILDSFVPPGKGYAEKVEEGYEKFGISKKYPWAKENLREASKGFVKKSGVDHLFTYGTLREGESRSHKLSKFSDRIIKDCKIDGGLIELHGDYPGLIKGDGKVVGEIHHLTDIKDALLNLDCIEGFRGYEKEDSLFNRIVVDCNEITCWIYVWGGNPEDGTVIESGDWCRK
ncbi:MAG: gamma-glutamylcyclotransferase [Crenarchaeota archaeon]|nr:gamma-glutamylcyclotransferase [Thermoproteota archaeon]